MATIHVDGKALEVDGADNLLQACLSLGLDIPYFCWHPALGSVGACRQCAVKQFANADDKRGRLVMSCMTPSQDGTIISIADDEAVAFRESVIEWLMTNHPHDCPVCEEGGHCHLQDMTVMTGHSERRYRFEKRTHQNQDLGPFINHEMNRCIACYRCVRYYKDYAGGTDLGVYGAHDNVYFGRAENGVLESEFSGNLTEVCPTGVFTDKTHSERYNRKWDMQFAPSICQGCSVGCNISPGERYGELRRIENRFNGDVNHYFLCYRGRFGYGYVNRKDRPKHAQLKRGGSSQGQWEKTSIDGVLTSAGDVLRHANRVIGIGSTRASLETNFALREMVGAENFFIGIGAQELALTRLVLDVQTQSPAAIPTLRQIESKDAVFVLGEDVTQTAARIALSIRQAAKSKPRKMAADKKVFDWQDEAIRNIGQRAVSPIFIGSFAPTRLDDIAEVTVHAAPEDLARIGFAVAHYINGNAPAVTDLNTEHEKLARHIAATLLAADKPLVVSGTGAGSAAIIQAASNIVNALVGRGKNPALSLVVPAANSIGVALLGGESIDAALAVLHNVEADAVVIVENDLYQHADATIVDAALAKVKTVVVVDHQHTATSDKATVIIPAASFAEADGTLVSSEGRAQRFFQVFESSYYDPSSQIREGWRWLHALHSATKGSAISWTQLDEVTAACAAAVPLLAKIGEAAPDANFRIKGMIKVAREPHRYSGRTAMRANISVHEPRAPQDSDSALAFSMEGFSNGNAPDNALIPFAWAPGWNSPQSWNKFQDEVGGNLRAGDPGTRLLEPAADASVNFFSDIPAAFTGRGDTLRVVPLYHLFGSDELSARAPVMESRIADSYVALNVADASRLGLGAGDLLAVTVGENIAELPLQINDGLVAGCIGLPVNLANIPNPLQTDCWAHVSKLPVKQEANA
ncbi:MAG: NADH-quinone oxidoreductase subunit NuoG [Spongiibacteraceae bacterium]